MSIDLLAPITLEFLGYLYDLGGVCTPREARDFLHHRQLDSLVIRGFVTLDWYKGAVTLTPLGKLAGEVGSRYRNSEYVERVVGEIRYPAMVDAWPFRFEARDIERALSPRFPPRVNDSPK